MVGEGVFPKVDGDILFASEANRFNPKLIGNVTQYSLENISGTDFKTVGGTINYPGAGSVQIHEYMIINVHCLKETAANVNFTYRLRFSGTEIDFTADSKSVTVAALTAFNFNFALTSGTINSNGGNIGSSFDIIVEGRSSNNSNTSRISDLLVIGN